MNMKTGVVDKNGNLIEMPYYEIGNFFKNIVKEYISLNEDNKAVYDDFKKDYLFFKPYYDFAIFKLGYKILNPLFNENTLGYAKDNKIIVENMYDDALKYYYSKTNDNEIEVKYADPNNIFSCIIDQDGRCFKVDREKDQFHEQIFEQVLNQIIIYNKIICEDYYNNCVVNHIFPNINFYFRDRLGFIQKSENYILYNKSLVNDYTMNLLNKIMDENKHLSKETSVLNENVIEETRNIIDCVSDEYENRRLRF